MLGVLLNHSCVGCTISPLNPAVFAFASSSDSRIQYPSVFAAAITRTFPNLDASLTASVRMTCVFVVIFVAGMKLAAVGFTRAPSSSSRCLSGYWYTRFVECTCHVSRLWLLSCSIHRILNSRICVAPCPGLVGSFSISLFVLSVAPSSRMKLNTTIANRSYSFLFAPGSSQLRSMISILFPFTRSSLPPRRVTAAPSTVQWLRLRVSVRFLSRDCESGSGLPRLFEAVLYSSIRALQS